MAAVALGRDFEFKVDRPEVCPTGLAEVDAMAGGLPQGCLTEVYGPASSGRTSLMLAAMAQSTGRENVCALVDASDAFDPASAAAAGVRLERLLWVRCGGNAEHALKAADLLVQGGGFGLVVMDLAGTAGGHRAAHFDDFLVPPATRCGAYAHGTAGCPPALGLMEANTQCDGAPRLNPERDE